MGANAAAQLGAARAEIRRLQRTIDALAAAVSERDAQIAALRREIGQRERRELWLAQRVVELETKEA